MSTATTTGGGGCSVSVEDINNLKNGEYIELNGLIHVRACEVTDHQQIFLCPFCRTTYKYNRDPYARARYLPHYHSFTQQNTLNNCGNNVVNITNIISSRFPHCQIRYNKRGNECKTFPKTTCTQFCIHVTEKTEKTSRKNYKKMKK